MLERRTHAENIIHAAFEAVVGVRIFVDADKQGAPALVFLFADTQRRVGFHSVFGADAGIAPDSNAGDKAPSDGGWLGDFAPDFADGVRLPDVLLAVVIGNALDVERGIDLPEVIRVNRKRNHEHVIVRVMEVVPHLGGYRFEPPAEKRSQRGTTNLASSSDIVTLLNCCGIVEEEIVCEQRAERMGEDDIGLESVDLFAQVRAQAGTEFDVLGKLSDHADLPLHRFIEAFPEAAAFERPEPGYGIDDAILHLIPEQRAKTADSAAYGHWRFTKEVVIDGVFNRGLDALAGKRFLECVVPLLLPRLRLMFLVTESVDSEDFHR
ncbi:MAG TPA: hypothetical protein VFD27_19235 [Chthoniobacteraceae bacterium]|nr:hypothetical protein [Chthoniobacteraceae bacterium]